MKVLRLRDRNPFIVAEWKRSFADVLPTGQVEISLGDIFDGPTADAVVSPANSFGDMDGGIDAAYSARFGLALQAQIQGVLSDRFFGELHVGQAIIVPTGDVPFGWLVSAPTMRIPMDVSRTLNAYVAFRAALIAVTEHNRANPRDCIDSLLAPGFCTAIGAMPPSTAAHQMRAAWDTVIAGQRWSGAAAARASQAGLQGGS